MLSLGVFSPRDEDLKIFRSTIGYSISHANKHRARACRKRGRRPETQKYASVALPFLSLLKNVLGI